jgi:hypothetical protein
VAFQALVPLWPELLGAACAFSWSARFFFTHAFRRARHEHPHADPFDGDACGSNLAPSANQDSLYTCEGGVTVSVGDSTEGCVAAPPSQTDYCSGTSAAM